MLKFKKYDVVVLKAAMFKPNCRRLRYRIVHLIEKFPHYWKGFRISIKPNLQDFYPLHFDSTEIERYATPREIANNVWRKRTRGLTI